MWQSKFPKLLHKIHKFFQSSHNLYDCHMVGCLTMHPSPSHPPKGGERGMGGWPPHKGCRTGLQCPLWVLPLKAPMAKVSKCQIDFCQWIVSNWRWLQNGVWWIDDCQRIVSNWRLSQNGFRWIDDCQRIVSNWRLSQNGVELINQSWVRFQVKGNS